VERVGKLARRLLDGFWFVPLAVAVSLALLALALLALDRAGGEGGVGLGFDGDASAARDILAAIAGSLITVAGLTFSLTIVTLQLVSGQFTPRALRGLLADRVTQLVAGTFVGIVAYALLVLRSVRDPADDGSEGFVPSLATTVAILLALSALVLLVVFVHHIGRTIQVSSIAGRLSRQTLAAVERLYPDSFGEELEAAPAPALAAWRAEAAPVVVRPARPGYVQAVLLDDLFRGLPTGGESRVAVSVAPGDFVTEATTAIEVWTENDADAAARAAARALVVDDERDVRQDPAFGVLQLADIALRAISPGVNDPTTAVTCIGYLRAVLERLAARAFPPELRRDEEAGVTAIARRTPFEGYLELAVAEIGRYATPDARVAGALLDALAAVAKAARRAGAAQRASVVVAAARRVAGPAIEDARTDADREALRAGLARVETAAVELAAPPQ
jgi:uncharacterized membrane protein